VTVGVTPAGRDALDPAFDLTPIRLMTERGVIAVSRDGTRDARDARLAYVVLTEAGRQLVTNATATLERMSEHIFHDRWTTQEIECLAELLGRMTVGLPGSVS